MRTYEYCHLAIGYSYHFDFWYWDKSKEFVRIKNKFNDAKVHVTTDKPEEEIPNLIYYEFDQKYPMFHSCVTEDTDFHKLKLQFNYNLKFLALKNALQTFNSDYLIYIDCDMHPSEYYDEGKLQKLFGHIEDLDVDLCVASYQRLRDDTNTELMLTPTLKEKATFFNLSELEGPLYSLNESMMVIRNNTKLPKFVEEWEKMYWFDVENDIQQYGECLEIGIAANKAKMNLVSQHSPIRSSMERCFTMPYDVTEETPNGIFYLF